MPNSADRSPDESPTRPFAAGSGGAPEEQQLDGGDATQVYRGTSPTQPIRPPDAIRVQPGPDATRVDAPGDGATAPQAPDDAPRWTARAGVPVPGDPALRQPAPAEWVEEEDPYQGRSWLTPVIVGLVAVVLVAALSVGLWLIYRATENGQNAPAETPSAPATSAAEAPPVPSSAPPATSAAPSSAAPVTTRAAPPAAVVIPPLRGDSLSEATVKLQVLGLNVRVERTADDSLPPGEVLSSRPGEGQTVAPGDTVTLVVAAAASPAPSKSLVSPSGG